MTPRFNRRKLFQLRLDGYIKEIPHPTVDLKILQFTDKAIDESRWTRETRSANTLIVDGGYNFVARPFEKVLDISEFTFNPKLGKLRWNEYPMVVQEKIDGTFGVLYFIDDEPFIATPDGFDSPQAQVATEILREKYGDYPWEREYTYCFEIVYPDNKHIIDYAESRDLILLAMVNTETGVEDFGQVLTLGLINEFITPKHLQARDDWRGMLDEVNETGLSEGIVVRFCDGLRVKFLTDQFLVKLEKEGRQNAE